MPKGLSLHIGLNDFDRTSPDYEGVSAPVLKNPIADANSMEALAKARGFSTLLLTGDKGEAATSDRVLGEIAKAAEELEPGDLFFLTYAGHGAQVPDQNGDEPDHLDETWVLWDRMVIDDELNRLLQTFKAGVRVAALSDSCHSQSVLREMYLPSSLADDYAKRDLDMQLPDAPPARMLTDEQKAADLFLSRHPDIAASPAPRSVDLAATVILLSGCQDNQTSSDGANHGLFTQTLLDVWGDPANPSFTGNYRSLLAAVVARMPPQQTPGFLEMGAADPDFEGQQPFTI